MWVAYNFLGSLMPIWGTYFLLHLYDQPFVLNDFAKHGEFALYTAAFLAPALQQVVKSIRNQKYVLGTGAVLIAVTGLVISAIIYSGLTTGLTLKTSLEQHGGPVVLLAKPSEAFLFSSTLVLFGSSLVFAFIVTLIENVLMDPSPSKMEGESEAKLRTQFKAAAPEPAVGLDPRVPDVVAAPPTNDELALKFTAPQGEEADQDAPRA
jgi:hypothetical protein